MGNRGIAVLYSNEGAELCGWISAERQMGCRFGFPQGQTTGESLYDISKNGLAILFTDSAAVSPERLLER